MFVRSLYKLLRQRTSSKTAGMSEVSPRNLTFVVSEGSCSTPCTTAELRATESCADVATGSQKGRQGRRLENFFAGKSRSAYGLSPELERSLSSSGTSATDDEGTERREECCKRGCSQILNRLSSVFEAAGRHNATKASVYLKSYPNPKKESRAYRNLTGKLCLSFQHAYS